MAAHGGLRPRFQLALLAILIMPVSLWLRFEAPVALSVRDACGGITYVLVFILVFGALSPKTSAAVIAIGVLIVTCFLEFLQLWHPAWLEALRRTIAGRLLLGTTFEWTDFPPYFIGAALGWALLRVLRKPPSSA